MKGDEIITRLKELRLKAGRTQASVAESMEVTQSAVSYWESGKVSPLKKYQKRLAQIYGVTEEELMEGENQNANGNAQGCAEDGKPDNHSNGCGAAT